MNLLEIVLYDRTGDTRRVFFRPGELNVVTGGSATGKSALLDIVDFCLGRETATMPVGPVVDTVSWYAVLVQIGESRVFIGRPAPKAGRSTSQQAMLEIGNSSLGHPAYSDLTVNADAAGVRQQLSRLVGIEEVVNEGGPFGGSFATSISHGILLCLQGQGEIDDKNLLFHRQGDPSIKQAIQHTLPYFLGAIPADQALKRQRLQLFRRELRRVEAEIRSIEKLNTDVEVDLQALVREAYGRGLIATSEASNRDEMLSLLRGALQVRRSALALEDDGEVARRSNLEGERDGLRRELRGLGEQRALLQHQQASEAGYEEAVTTGVVRLQSLNLVPDDGARGSNEVCPICESRLQHSDPSVVELRQTLETMSAQLRRVSGVKPRRVAALEALETEAAGVRQRLRGVEQALEQLVLEDRAAFEMQRTLQAQAFTQGRIDLYLGKISEASDDSFIQLRERADSLREAILQIETDLDPEEEREQLTSRLNVVGLDMTDFANRLELEHSGANVRLDLKRLTVVADIATGPAPLYRIGSGENWVGYHLAAHLALHKYFVRLRRPVPHFLILDQPTQAYYPSEVSRLSGEAESDTDRAAVRRLYRLMLDVVSDVKLEGKLQIIVLDHANLPEQWFQDSVRHNWRDGRKLIPEEWIARAAELDRP
ncbi:DUF3732 domain-containing protein [Micromonospora sp. S-DT3-3-22]|uniref:DUF3732 domain-containing protein n=1 Tax=Micromonospora sp. S-DT3-3-22 TaxID=2755359 RepID=UPI0018907733|nr:DUF3732 domain-containing protein [Micromonospora sp. S-DT3-3-22]